MLKTIAVLLFCFLLFSCSDGSWQSVKWIGKYSDKDKSFYKHYVDGYKTSFDDDENVTCYGDGYKTLKIKIDKTSSKQTQIAVEGSTVLNGKNIVRSFFLIIDTDKEELCWEVL